MYSSKFYGALRINFAEINILRAALVYVESIGTNMIEIEYFKNYIFIIQSVKNQFDKFPFESTKQI